MLIVQSPVRANAVLEAILDSVGEDTQSFNMAVAYATYEGARTLVDGLQAKIGTSWGSIPKAVVTCFDFGHTEPDALMYLSDGGFQVGIANLGAGSTIRLRPNPSAFHPKVYIAPTAVEARFVVGSANLSRRALTVNTEAVSASLLTGADAWREVWAHLTGRSVKLSDELLNAYRAIRPERWEIPLAPEPPIPPPAPPAALPVFRDEVEDGLDPGEYAAFWVDVGYSSGGSGNQLELPRLGHRFFGFYFDDYGTDHVTIGEPEITAGTDQWTRPLTWHGSNRMERINLPTAAQGGFEYRNRVVLFERAGESFEITVADTGSGRATRWRDESAALGRLFRVSNGSDRLCGLL